MIFTSVRDFLASVDPRLPWLVLWLSTFLACWAVRRWAPGVWRVAFAWVPADAPAMTRRALQGAVVAAPAAVLAGLASGGDLVHVAVGALCGAIAPVTHHVMRAYSGELGPGSTPAPPASPPTAPLTPPVPPADEETPSNFARVA